MDLKNIFETGKPHLKKIVMINQHVASITILPVVSSTLDVSEIEDFSRAPHNVAP
jgi:hypothetical protein